MDFITDKNEIVQKDWFYSYDDGGITAIIPAILPVTEDMIGLPAYKAAFAWEYFLKPKK